MQTRRSTGNTDAVTLVSFSRLGLQLLTLPMQLLLKKEYAAYDLTGRLPTSRGRAFFRICQTQMDQLCCSCPFNAELSGEKHQGVLQLRSESISIDICISLNLTAANRAYLMEPHWNPTIEEQALARIHRLGQTRPVVTIRLVMQESIEEASISPPVILFG